MREITEELYAANIPKECFYQTIEQHKEELMLCYRLCKSLKEEEPMSCTGCELAVNVKQQEQQQ